MAEVRALLVPVKAFGDAKLRLAPVLDLKERRELARELAAGVLGAGGDLGVFVVCDDHEVAAFAEGLGATVLWTPGLGLSGAVAAGVAHLGSAGVDLAVVAHADLVHPEGLGRLGEEGRATLVPDRRRNGTNVLAVPTRAGFSFSYGPGSFARHLAEAARLGLEVVVVEDDLLAVDVDLPEDLALIGR